MVTDQELGELFAKIGFKVDLKGIQQAKAVMKALEAQARNTGKAIDKALKGTGGAGQAAKNMVVAQQAQTKAQHQAQLQNAKLAKINNSSRASGLKTQQQQVALQIKQAQLAAQQQKAAYAAASSNLATRSSRGTPDSTVPSSQPPAATPNPCSPCSSTTTCRKQTCSRTG